MDYKETLQKNYKDYESTLKLTNFFQLEEMVVILSNLFQVKKIQFYERITGRFSRAIATRIINESFAFCACLKLGAFNASYHHIRDLIETVAIFHFVYTNRDSDKRWFERYIEYAEIWTYNDQKKSNPKIEKFLLKNFVN